MQRLNLVFIHGFMGQPADWDELRQRLSKEDVESSALAISASNSWQASVQALAESIPLGSILVGYSMGARLSLALALDFPEKCGGLVFVSGNPGIRSEVERQRRWQADQLIAQRLESEPIQEFLESWYEQSVFAGVSPMIRANEINRKGDSYSSTWPQIMMANSIARQPNYWSRLTELAIPVLTVAGDKDEKYKTISFEMNALLENSELAIAPDCGHIVHQENPEWFEELILQFIGSLNSRSAQRSS